MLNDRSLDELLARHAKAPAELPAGWVRSKKGNLTKVVDAVRATVFPRGGCKWPFTTDAGETGSGEERLAPLHATNLPGVPE